MGKRKKHHEEHMDESWLIPYADVLTLLLALFIVLFAMSQVEEDKFQQMQKVMETLFSANAGIMVSDKGFTDQDTNPDQFKDSPQNFAEEEEQLQKYKERLDEYFRQQGMQGIVTNIITEQGLLISMQEVALFDSGRADLRPQSQIILRHLAEILSELDNDVQVSGHTDNLPINTLQFPSNWELSTQRALNVMRNMISNEPRLGPERFSVVGYAEYRPRESNDTAEGRAQNRRVELLILRVYVMEG